MRPRELFAPLLLAVTIAFGFGLVWATAVAWIGSWVAPPSDGRKTVLIRHDGTLAFSYYSQQTFTQQFEDRHGAPIEIPDDEVLPAIIGLQGDGHWPEHWWSTWEVDWPGRLRGFNDTRKQPAYWYAIWDGRLDGSAYFIGYDEASKRSIGFLGRDGFRTSLADTRSFAFGGCQQAMMYDFVSPQHWGGGPRIPSAGGRTLPLSGWDAAKLYLRSPDYRLYEVDLKARTVRSVLDGETIVACRLEVLRDRKDGLAMPVAPADSGTVLVVRTDREVLLLDKELHILRRYTLPRELLTKFISWSEVAPGKAIGSWSETIYDPDHRTVQHLAWFDAGGTVSHREQISFPAQSNPSNVFVALVAPSLAVDAVVFGLLYPQEMLAAMPAASWPEALQWSIEAVWSTIMLTLVISVLLAVGCYRRQARFAASGREQIVWPLFVLIAGLPGWIGYRYGRRWPVVERCPHCGVPIPRDSEQCVRCRRELPRPAPLGTEVFA